MSTTVQLWHICIGGLFQTEAEPSGLDRVWYDLHRCHHGPHTVVEYREYDADWRHLAERIARYSDCTRPPTVCIYAYSWGGWSAVLLAKALDERGIDVRAMVLCDAVYRHWYWLGQWRALVPWSKIRVPGNVREVHWFYQVADLPRGHRVVAADPQKTTVHEPVVLSLEHGQMDDAAVFLGRCLYVAANARAEIQPKWPA